MLWHDQHFISFFLLNNILLSSFVYQFTPGRHSSCFYFVAPGDDTVVNIHLEIFTLTYFFTSSYISRNGIAGSPGN